MRIVSQSTLANRPIIESMMVIGATIVVVIASLFLYHSVKAAPTTLSPNDVVIVTANSDSGWSTTACTDGAPGGTHSNAIDLLLRKDIGSGTQIKVTDNAWNGSALTTTEGFITYTATADLPAGTVIRYSDCLYNQGGSGWTRSTPLASFDAGVSGDTLLVYQGTEASPNFIYGFGFRSNSWITSGSPSSTNSRIPAALSSASPAAYVALGSTTSSRNYQYVGGTTAIYSPNFLTNLKVTANWNANGGASAGTSFGPTTTSFDTTRPSFTSVVRQTPTAAITSTSGVTFRITASEGVQPLMSSGFSPIVTGSLTYGSMVVSAVSGSVYDVTITGLSGEGTISLGTSYSGSLIDLSGNPAIDTSFTSPMYTRDVTDPVVTINSLVTNQSQPALSGSISEPADEVVVTVNGVNYNAIVSGTTWSLPAGTISPALVDGVYDIEVIASDMAGNLGVDATVNELTIDTLRSTVMVGRTATQSSQTNVDNFTFDVVFSKPIVAGSFTAADITISGSAAVVTNFVQLSSTAWVITISGATDGDTITVSIADGATQDAAGNNNVASAGDNNTVFYDISAPIVTVVSLSTTSTSPALRGTVNDPYATVTVTVNGIEYPAINDGAGNWSIAEGLIAPALTLGVYDVSVRASDVAGNIGSDTTTNELTVYAADTDDTDTTDDTKSPVVKPSTPVVPKAPDAGAAADGLATLIFFTSLIVLVVFAGMFVRRLEDKR